MSLNLATAKTFRQYAAIEGVNHPDLDPEFVHAPPPGDAITPDDSPIVTAVAATNLLNTVGHGLVADVRVRFTTTGTLPAGLSLATDYYVIASGLTLDAFKVSATSGGSEIDITDTGTGAHAWARSFTAFEAQQIAGWKANRRDSDVTEAQGVLALAAWLTYWNNPKHKAWIIDDRLERHWQWIYRSADHADAAQAATPPSASGSGAITTSPPASPANASPN